MHGEKAEIGVLTASSQALTPAHFANCATPMESVHIRGMEGNPEFWETIIEGKRHDFDMERLEAEIVGSAAAFARKRRSTPLCSNAPTFPPSPRPSSARSTSPSTTSIRSSSTPITPSAGRITSQLSGNGDSAVPALSGGFPPPPIGRSPLLSDGSWGNHFSGRQGISAGWLLAPSDFRKGNDSPTAKSGNWAEPLLNGYFRRGRGRPS